MTEVLPSERDAFGRALWDRWQGEPDANDMVERDDGFIAVEDTQRYLDPFRRWPAVDRQAFRLLKGRVLDVGCGGGRVALELQQRGRVVAALDVSPGAVDVCRARGVADVRLASMGAVDATWGPVDTIALFGNNIGLLETPARATRTLRRFSRVLADGGSVVGVCLDPYGTDDPLRLAYQARNRERGRASGQIRLRIRYRAIVGPWFDYLFVSADELRSIAAEAGWVVTDVLEGEGSVYGVRLRPGT